MKNLPLSPKYQVVIPKEARKIMGIDRSTQAVYVKRLSSDEIVLAKAPNTKNVFLDLVNSTPPVRTDAVKRIRKLRDDWDS